MTVVDRHVEIKVQIYYSLIPENLYFIIIFKGLKDCCMDLQRLALEKPYPQCVPPAFPAANIKTDVMHRRRSTEPCSKEISGKLLDISVSIF